MTDDSGSNKSSEKEGKDSSEVQSPPYEKLLSQVVAKIKDEPFLFVIAIVALIIGLVVLGTGLGSSMMWFTISIIAILAAAVIAGYYIREGQKMIDESKPVTEQRPPKSNPSMPLSKQEANAEDGGKLEDVLQEGLDINSQSVTAKGKGSSAKGIIQTSTSRSNKKKNS